MGHRQPGRPALRLIEIDVDAAARNEGHPPGAVAWNWTSQLQDQVSRDVADLPAIQTLLLDTGVLLLHFRAQVL